MIATVTNHISRGVRNMTDSSLNGIWWRANFNMPVRNYMSDTTTTVRYQGAWFYLTETTTYDLTGFVPGLEICNGAAIFDFENNTASPVNISTNLTVRWVDTDGSTTMFYIANSYPFSYIGIPAFSYVEAWWGGNTGCRNGEVDTTGVYYFKSKAVGSPNIAEVSTAVTMQNVPSVATTGSIGRIYVDGNYLALINANNFLHKILGTDLGDVSGTPGYIWMDTFSDIHYIDSSGHDRRLPWKIKQFASFYSNGATGATFAGVSKAGHMWMDSEFGLTHLAYIGSDGYKYLAGAGDYPYE